MALATYLFMGRSDSTLQRQFFLADANAHGWCGCKCCSPPTEFDVRRRRFLGVVLQ
uniref:Uncharacterized protein n=1 Tax=Arundo donax TaxID=35708 RepID=A0A0A9UBR4_ARUDO